MLQWLAGVDGWEQLRGSAVEGVVPGVGRVLFAGYEDLVAMKRAADRPQDRADPELLERVRE